MSFWYFFVYYAAVSCQNILPQIRKNIPQSNKNNGKDIWSQSWSVCRLCLPTANPTPAKGRQTAFSCTVFWQLPKIKIGQIFCGKKFGEFKTNFRHMVTVLHIVIYHSSFDRKILFFHLLCSSFPVPMPLTQILRSNVTIARCRVKIFFND